MKNGEDNTNGRGTAAIKTTSAAATAATKSMPTAAAAATKSTPEIAKENAGQNEREK